MPVADKLNSDVAPLTRLDLTAENVPVADKSDATENVPVADKSLVLLALAYEHRHHDAWHWNGLGKPCMTCYAILSHVGEITARGLAKLVK